MCFLKATHARLHLGNTAFEVQGDHAGRTKPPVDFKTKVPL